MARLSKHDACTILSRLSIRRGDDFHALSSSKVDELVTAAIAAKYHKPKSANGSRGRYFHAYLQRACR